MGIRESEDQRILRVLNEKDRKCLLKKNLNCRFEIPPKWEIKSSRHHEVSLALRSPLRFACFCGTHAKEFDQTVVVIESR